MLLILLAAIAVASRWTTPPPSTTANQALRHDLQRSLIELWGSDRQQVDLASSPGGMGVAATVTLPEGASAQQRTWNLPFLKFVALRHPQVKVADWQVKIPQIQFFTPFQLTPEESKTCALLTRQVNLIPKPLASDAMVLVDTIQRFGAPEVALLDHPLTEECTAGRIVCVVVQHPLPQATQTKLRQELALLSYDTFRILVLPSP